MTTFPCSLCREPLEIRTSKKGRPYLVCDDCLCQWFVRGDKGIERLKKLAERETSFLNNFVVCEKCRIAVEICDENISGGTFRERGIRCPKCERLLLKRKEE